jgi:hypothetical protein
MLLRKAFTVRTRVWARLIRSVRALEFSHMLDFKDHIVLPKAGSACATVFDAWYDYLSPFAASSIAANDSLLAWVKVLLYALLSVLSIRTMMRSLFGGAPKFALVVGESVASSLTDPVCLRPFKFLDTRAHN